jgi:hypothetical protein
MLIIDLDEFPTLPKVAKKQVQETAPFSPPTPARKEYHQVTPTPAPDTLSDKDKLLRKLEEEDSYVRYLRAMNHQKYFDQLDANLMPIKGADFSEVYAEQKVFRERLKSIYLKRLEVEKTGTITQPKCLTDSELAQLGALKHERSNALKNAGKLRKKTDEAKAKGDLARENKLSRQLDELQLKIMQYSHQIKLIVENGAIPRQEKG